MEPEDFKSGKVQMHHVALLHVQQCIMLDCQNLSILHLWIKNTKKNKITYFHFITTIIRKKKKIF